MRILYIVKERNKNTFNDFCHRQLTCCFSVTALLLLFFFSENLREDQLDSIPEDEKDIKEVCKNTKSEIYPFLALELGLNINDISRIEHDNHGYLWAIVYALLKQWRHQNHEKATTRVLLDTAKYVGIDIKTIQENLASA